MKSIRYTLLFLGLMMLCVTSAFSSVQVERCFEIKHLEFFGIDDNTRVSWSDSELNALVDMPETQSRDGSGFLIPLLIYQLKDFYPACNKEINQKRYANLKKLYLKIRQKEIPQFDSDRVAKEIEFLRDDFFGQLENDQALASMVRTFDDGPLYGIPIEGEINSESYERVATDFGELTLSKMGRGLVLAAKDNEGKIMWARIVVGAVPERKLANMILAPDPIRETSLATIVHFFAEGERLRVYLRPDGRFMFYYHSW